MSVGFNSRARRSAAAPFPGPIAADAFEAAIESAIVRAHDLFDLDGETFVRYRNGHVETFDSDAAQLSFD